MLQKFIDLHLHSAKKYKYDYSNIIYEFWKRLIKMLLQTKINLFSDFSEAQSIESNLTLNAKVKRD